MEYRKDENTSATHLINCIQYLKSTLPDCAKWFFGVNTDEYADNISWISIEFMLHDVMVCYGIDWNLDADCGYLSLNTDKMRSKWKEYPINELPHWEDLEQDLRQCITDAKNIPNMEKEKRRKQYLALKREFECE